MGSISFINKASSGGSIKPNIFIQETEPEIKEGIWIKANKELNKINVVDEISMGKWVTSGITAIPYGDTGRACVTVGTEIFIFGGYNNANKAYKYDILTNTYTKLSDIPYGFANGIAVTDNSNIYLVGGTNAAPKYIYKYNIASDTYEKMTDLEYQFYAGAGCLINSEIYLFTYSMTSGVAVFKYNILNGQSTELQNFSSFPIKLDYGAGINIGTNMYLFGGMSNRTLAYKYDITTNTYEKLADIPYECYQSAICTDGSNIYLFGGTNKYSQKAYKYNIVDNQYIQLTDIPNVFDFGYATCIDENIYLFGTKSNHTGVEKFQLTSFEDKTVIIVQGEGQYKTKLLSISDIQGNLLYPFDDVYYNTTESGLDDTLPTYYGTGTEWVKFKN